MTKSKVLDRRANLFFVVSGQTATGKTDRAIELAQKHNGEIISADSRQVYKHLDIVTGKDTHKFIEAGVRVHLLGVVDPKERFSSHEFVELAKTAIQDIQSRNKSVIVVGGTYLYIKHLLYGFDVAVPPNEPLRNSLELKSVQELQAIITALFAQKGSVCDMNESDFANPRRLIRKIEILSAETQNRDTVSAPRKPIYKIDEYIGLRYTDKTQLEQAIRRRVQDRLHAGALQEVKNLLAKGYTHADAGLSGIGYTQLIKHLEGEYSLEQAANEWTTKELQYAKRQYTFMKSDSNIKWLIV